MKTYRTERREEKGREVKRREEKRREEKREHGKMSKKASNTPIISGQNLTPCTGKRKLPSVRQILCG
jgi:hypothetical protein